MNNPKEEIKKLVKLLNKWSKEYYENDLPSVSDAQYDGAYNTLLELEKQYPQYIQDDSPTKRVGGRTNNKFKKVKHDFPMLSLANAFSKEDLLKFDKQIKDKLFSDKDLSYAAEYKIDGLSISLKYKNGKLLQGITRGDGVYGEDVTHNIREIRSIPKAISYTKPLEIRGEIFMPLDVFKELNENGVNLANPRNAASGSLRQLNSRVVRERKLDAFLYQIPNALEHGLETHEETLNFLKDLGFKVNDKTIILNNIHEVIQAIDDLTNIKDNLNYEVDGIVIKINNYNLNEDIGFTVKFPKFMIAYKFPEEISQTTLEKIFPTVGRTGRITYNAKLLPVRLGGTTVSAATLHNAEYIKEKNIAEGDIVSIKKAGEIIPKVLGHVKKNNNTLWEEALYCPSCNSLLKRYEGEVDQYCINQECPAIKQAKLEHFVSRGAMNIEGVSSEIIRTFIKKGFISNIASIYKLKDKREQLLNLHGFKEKSIDNILDSIEKSKTQTLDKLIFGLGIRHVGSKNALLIAKRFGTLQKIINASIEQLNSIRGLGPKVASAVINYFNNQEHIELINELISLGVKPKEFEQNESEKLKDKTFVITGTLSKPRTFFKDLIERNGGNVSGAVSKNTNYLLAGENSGSKLNKAKQLNIEIINEEKLFNLLGKEQIWKK